MKRIIAILVVIIVIIVGAINLFKTRKAQVNQVTTPTIPTLTISLTKAKKGEIVKSEKFLALLESKQEAKISTKLSGYIQKISVIESQHVKKGDSLIVIDNGELLTTLKTLRVTKKQQKEDYLLTEKIYYRNQKLYKVGALPKEKLETSKLLLQGKMTQLISTKEKIKQLSIQLEYLDIKAPFDGIIGQIILQEGSLAVPAQPIITMSQSAQKITFSFVSKMGTIKEGQSIFIDNVEVGSIKTIYTQAKNGLSVAEVALNRIIALPEGSSLSIEVIINRQIGCILPVDTLIYGKDGTHIMEYTNGKFTNIDIEVLFENTKEALVSFCPKGLVAQGSESKLTKLGFYKQVKIRDINDK